MGFGQGSAGVGGEFFQLLVIIFMELFGVSLGQFIGAVSPSMQIAPLFNPYPSPSSYNAWTIPQMQKYVPQNGYVSQQPPLSQYWNGGYNHPPAYGGHSTGQW